MLKLSNKKFVIELIISIILGTLGAILAWYLNMPAPFLLGPTIVCSISAIMGLKFSIPDFLLKLPVKSNLYLPELILPPVGISLHCRYKLLNVLKVRY